MTPRFPARAADILALLEGRGAETIDVPVLQPAEPFLDMAGEDLRRRIFLTESETGATLCLRPEFTIPVCLAHIAEGHEKARRVAYLGEVFRQHRDGTAEFFQCGLEDIGDMDVTGADARSLADALALFDLLLPGHALVATLGDQAVFEAVLAALGLPRGWQKRLARAFGAPDLLKAALADLAGGGMALDTDTAALLDAGGAAALEAHIAEQLAEAGLNHGAGRGAGEIARRLTEKAELARTRLSADAMAALEAFLAIHVPLDEAPAALAGFADAAGIALDGALERFAARAAAMRDHGLAPHQIVYDAAFGRPLDYYTGLVFEIRPAGGARPLAGGGRYDRLLTMLGAPGPVPGVGFSVWLDRVEREAAP